MKIKAKLATALLALSFAGCATLAMTESDPVQFDEANPPAIMALHFDSYGDRLNGIMYQANGIGPHPTVVLLHGYPGNEKNLDLAQSLRRAGYNVLFFHYRGAWGSSGDFTISHVVEDVGSALGYLRENADDIRVDRNRLLIVGHSMGGFAALQGAAHDKGVTCVAGIAPADVGRIADLAQADADFAKSFADGADDLPMLNGWSGAVVTDELKNNRDRFSLIDLAPNLNGKSVLLIAGDKDTVLPPAVFHAPLVAALKAESNIALTHAVIPGDHSFSWSRFKLIDTVINWAQKCESTE